MKGDVAILEQMETDDVVFIQDGLLVDKQAQISGLRKRAGKPLNQTNTVDVHKAAIEGNAVVLTGFNTVQSGKDSEKAAFTEMWVRSGNTWRIKAAHYSSVPKK